MSQPSSHHPTLSRPRPRAVRTETPLDPIQQQHLVHDRVARLAAEAASERLARHARHARAGHPADESDPIDAHAHTGLRVAIGRALIGLGTAIAATSDDAADAPMGRAA
jgi:hypothetical protein